MMEFMGVFFIVIHVCGGGWGSWLLVGGGFWIVVCGGMIWWSGMMYCDNRVLGSWRCVHGYWQWLLQCRWQNNCDASFNVLHISFVGLVWYIWKSFGVMRWVPLGRVIWDKLVMWCSRSLLRKWWQRLLLKLEYNVLVPANLFLDLWEIIKSYLSGF